MDFNKSLIKKIDNILKLSEQFDKLCSIILSSNVHFDKTTVENVLMLTSTYMMIRSEHGLVIILNDQLKNKANPIINEMKTNKISITNTNILYDISTFTSIIENINNLVNNIDFEFKKIALMYPKLINKDVNHIILFVGKIKDDDKYVRMIEELKETNPEYSYHILEHNIKNKKFDCGKILGKSEPKTKLTINIEKLPCGFLTNGSTITEIPLEKIKKSNDLIKMLD